METVVRSGWGRIPALGLRAGAAAAAVAALASGACGGAVEISVTESTVEPEDAAAPGVRQAGHVDGVRFLVGEGSEATFTVEEQFADLPLPNDAVVRTTSLSGEVYLDGRPSVIAIDLHELESDQPRRDQYIRSRMFPSDPMATFTLDNAGPLPDGFADGDDVTTTITGQLEIRGAQAPVTFDIEARDDGDVIFILGRTTFEWEDLGMTAPQLPFLDVRDQVRTEVLLAVRPADS